MFYKALKDGIVLDVLDHLTYVRYIEKTDVMVACVRSEAQAICASEGDGYWHVYGLYHIDGYETVELVEIDQSEYEQLKAEMKK